MKVAVVQTTPGGRGTAIDSLGPGRLRYPGLRGANRWSLVETHSLWASAAYKALVSHCAEVVLFSMRRAQQHSCRQKDPRLLRPRAERNKQTKP